MSSHKSPIQTPTFSIGTESGINLAVKQIRSDLVSHFALLRWFGIAEKRVNADGIIYPAVYQSTSKDYLNMLPNDNWKPGYGFFDVSDPQEILHDKEENGPQVWPTFQANLSIIVYVDVSRLYTTPGDYRYVKQVIKEQLLDILHRKLTTLQGFYTSKRMYEKEIEQIYKGYTVKEVDRQYLQIPYYGLRIEGEVIYQDTCTPSPYWILQSGYWDDNGEWADAETWKDA
jgi:hypothetical protein